MKLWKLSRGHDWEYDQVVSMVVWAKDEQQARQAAYDSFDPEWDVDQECLDYLSPVKTTCDEITLGVEPFVIHKYIHHG